MSQYFVTEEKENEMRVHIRMEVMMCVSWNGKEVYKRLKSGFIYCLVSKTYCEFKISNLFCFCQSCIDILHDDLQGSFIEMPRN